MKEYKREYPMFSLCGLNCGLCPRHQSEGSSKCPGCGGEDFHLKHPNCTVISCSKKHGNVEYCFLCEEYPCERYKNVSPKDSFISYINVLSDMKRAKEYGVEVYKSELNEKIALLEHLLSKHNDGKKKGFYCLALNLLSLADIKEIVDSIDALSHEALMGERIAALGKLLYEKANEKGIELKLRK